MVNWMGVNRAAQAHPHRAQSKDVGCKQLFVPMCTKECARKQNTKTVETEMAKRETPSPYLRQAPLQGVVSPVPLEKGPTAHLVSAVATDH